MKKLLTLIPLVLILLAAKTNAQEMRLSRDEALIIGELRTVVTDVKEKLKVQYIMDKRQRDEKYREIEIKSGDEIIYFNGEKIEKITELRKRYEEIKKGEEIKLGIRRGEEKLILSFEKGEKFSGPLRISGGH